MSHARSTDTRSSTEGSESSGTESTVSPASGLGSDPTLVAPRRADPATPSGGNMMPLVDPARYAIAGELAHGGIGRILRARDDLPLEPDALRAWMKDVTGSEAATSVMWR